MRRITRDQFEWALFRGKLGAFKCGHLEQFDYDPPTLRAAVVSASSETWVIVKMVALDVTATRRFRGLHDYAVMLLGDPPWRRSRAVVSFGRLGFLEKSVAALPVPAIVEPYSFDVDKDGRAMCRPDVVDFVEAGLPASPPPDRERASAMSDAMRWRKVYDRYVEDMARERRVAERERMK